MRLNAETHRRTGRPEMRIHRLLARHRKTATGVSRDTQLGSEEPAASNEGTRRASSTGLPRAARAKPATPRRLTERTIRKMVTRTQRLLPSPARKEVHIMNTPKQRRAEDASSVVWQLASPVLRLVVIALDFFLMTDRD